MKQKMPNTIILEVQTLDSGVRLDVFIQEELTDQGAEISRSRIQSLIEHGFVKVDGKAAKSSQKVKPAQSITVDLPEPESLSIEAQEIHLNIVFEDSDLLVVNKVAGMVVHPGAGINRDTLVNALLYHCRDELSGIGGAIRPGIVHRLDKDTSGLLVVAKSEPAHLSLSRQISERTAKRIYLGIVEGMLGFDKGTVDKPIGRHPKDRTRMAIVKDGRRAVTHFESLMSGRKFTLVKASLETGRTHQIRVHMASLNCPIVGDIVYNNKTTGNLEARRKLGLVGHALHATYLSFKHPISNQLLEFEAPPPPDFGELRDKLE